MSSRASSNGSMTPRSTRSLASSRGFNSNHVHRQRSVDNRSDNRSTGPRSNQLPNMPHGRNGLAPLSEIDEIGGMKRRRQN